MTENAVRIVQVEDVDDPNGRTPPPIWAIVVVIFAVITGGWLLVSQGSTDSDGVTSPTLLPVIPEEASVATPTATSPTAADPVSPSGNQPAVRTFETPQQLRGYVAVASGGDPPFSQDIVWVFRPGGSLVSRTYDGTGRFNAEYPMLITSGRLLIDSANWISDIDLAEQPISSWTDGSVIPGSGPGVVWLTRRIERITGDSMSVSPVDVESLTVGEPVDVTDLFSRPIVGVADGLMVVPIDEETYGRFAYWSPTDGLAPLRLCDLHPDNMVVAASGNLVVVKTSEQSVDILDIVSGEHVGTSKLPGIRRPVTSACISPDGQHVIVVGWNGAAVVGNISTGEVVVIEPFGSGITVQRKHGIGWTTDDQLVFIGNVEHDSINIFGFDIATGERFVVAELEGPKEWWLTANGTMC